ncbi:D-2-hydroxyacid dehydrogenase [Acidothermaceae bacterium B102]|nr:D-2-hydroxyacid dehydrogenase [Acidothermaceae bacterium B102]
MRYLSTLGYSTEWLDALRAAVPGLDVQQITADKASDVPDEVWARVDVLHTSTVFPEPAVASRLRWVQLDTSGIDHVRESPQWASPVQITTIGGISPVPLAEYVMFGVLGLAHRLPAMLDVQATRRWPSASVRWEKFLPARIDGATMVILGYGRLGREIGRLAQAHGMSVVGVTRTARLRTPDELALLADFGRSGEGSAEVEVVGPERLHEVLGRADYLVVVLPLTAETRGAVGPEAVAALKPGAYVINAARGGIVDEAALLEALRSGAVAGALLDVFDDEPLPPDSPWWSEPHAFVTPHVAGLAPRYYEQVLEIVVGNLRRFADGAPLHNLVDRVLGY